VRLSHPIRRIGIYPVPFQFDKDLRAEVTLVIKADRPLDGFTETGEPIATEEPEAAAEGHEERGHRRRRDHDDDFGDFGDEEKPRRRERGERRDKRR
jgi:hypothetical protein